VRDHAFLSGQYDAVALVRIETCRTSRDDCGDEFYDATFVIEEFAPGAARGTPVMAHDDFMPEQGAPKPGEDCLVFFDRYEDRDGVTRLYAKYLHRLTVNNPAKE